MKKYELTAVISEHVDEDDFKKTTEKIQKAITEHQGKIENEEDLGRKKLSYAIKKNEFGYFLVYCFEADPSEVNKINSELKSKSNILRILIMIAPTKAQEVKIEEKIETTDETKEADKAEKVDEAEEVKLDKKQVTAEDTEIADKTEKAAKVNPSRKKRAEVKIKIKPVKKEKEPITQEMESEEERLKKLDEELGKILEE